MKFLTKAKDEEREKLSELGFVEHSDNGREFFYLKNGKKLEHCHRFSFDQCVTKTVSKSGVTFDIDTQDDLQSFRAFAELVLFINCKNG